MNNQEIIAVVLAASTGKIIEMKQKHNDRWEQCTAAPLWAFSTMDYRVKPEPPCLYGVQLADGTLTQSTWFQIESAESAVKNTAPDGSCVVKLVLAPDEEQPF